MNGLTRPTGALARDVLTQAQVEGIHFEAIPTADAGAIAAADQVVKAATDAWHAGIRGTEVVAVLAVAFEAMKPTTAPATYSDLRNAQLAVKQRMGGRP